MSPDLHTLTGAYAVDALPPGEREEFERHLRACAACTQEVLELQATAGRLALGATEPAPPGLRERVFSEISRVRQLPPADLPRRTAQDWWRSPMAAAAAVLLVISVALGVVAIRQQRELDSSTTAQIGRIIEDPDRVTASAPAQGGGTGTVVAADGKAVFLASGLGQLPEDEIYQLWLVAPSGIRSAGVLDVRDGRTASLVDVGDADAMAVSVEPAGGSEQPTTEPLWSVEV